MLHAEISGLCSSELGKRIDPRFCRIGGIFLASLVIGLTVEYDVVGHKNGLTFFNAVRLNSGDGAPEAEGRMA